VDTRINTWHDFGTGERGNIIDLVLRMENCNVQTALRKLSDFYACDNTEHRAAPSFFQSKNILSGNPATIILNIQPITHPKLIEWARERKIDLRLSNMYCREIHYQNQSGNHYSVGFVNDKGGYELSSPPNFKGCIAPKEITTIRNNSSVCLIFEGFWDFLSYLTIKKQERTSHDVAVLNSTANAEKAVPFLKTHAEIYAFLDNDDAGRKATELIKSVCQSVKDCSSKFAGHKDLNDYLCGKKQVQEQRKKRGMKM
jgi:hypothetical protein